MGFVVDREYESLSPNAQDPLYPEEGILPSFTQEGASERLGMSHWDSGSNQANCMDWTSTLAFPIRLEDMITPATFLSNQTLVSLSEEAQADLQ